MQPPVCPMHMQPHDLRLKAAELPLLITLKKQYLHLDLNLGRKKTSEGKNLEGHHQSSKGSEFGHFYKLFTMLLGYF